MNKLKLRQMLQQFFLEDMGERDVTSESIFGEKIGQTKRDIFWCSSDL
jgi:nicotinate-nucleotide pyrophosphorylase (carboxylating)